MWRYFIEEVGFQAGLVFGGWPMKVFRFWLAITVLTSLLFGCGQGGTSMISPPIGA